MSLCLREGKVRLRRFTIEPAVVPQRVLQCRTHRLYSSGTQTGRESAPPRRRRTRSPPTTTNQGTRAGGPKKHQHTSTERRVCVSHLSPCHVDAFISRGEGVEVRGQAHRRGARRDAKRRPKGLHSRRNAAKRFSGGSRRAANERRGDGVERAAVERAHRLAGRRRTDRTRAPRWLSRARGD